MMDGDNTASATTHTIANPPTSEYKDNLERIIEGEVDRYAEQRMPDYRDEIRVML